MVVPGKRTDPKSRKENEGTLLRVHLNPIGPLKRLVPVGITRFNSGHLGGLNPQAKAL
jgi:hypothetical protein